MLSPPTRRIEEQLKQEIEYWDYSRYFQAKLEKIPLDSVKYDKQFDRVTKLWLRLSKNELEFTRKSLTALGFVEQDRVFIGNDLEMEYELTEANPFMLKQIDFKLTGISPDKELVLNRLTIKWSGDKASFLFGKE